MAERFEQSWRGEFFGVLHCVQDDSKNNCKGKRKGKPEIREGSQREKGKYEDSELAQNGGGKDYDDRG